MSYNAISRLIPAKQNRKIGAPITSGGVTKCSLLWSDDLLYWRMTKFSKLLIVAVLGVLSNSSHAAENGCKGCDIQKEESPHREQIKADRAKYDRENERITARPWDAIKDGGPLTLPEKGK
jgi:hypothetical protein